MLYFFGNNIPNLRAKIRDTIFTLSLITSKWHLCYLYLILCNQLDSFFHFQNYWHGMECKLTSEILFKNRWRLRRHHLSNITFLLICKFCISNLTKFTRHPEDHSEPSQTCKMKLLTKIVSDCKLLAVATTGWNINSESVEQKYSAKKLLLKIVQNSQENICARFSFLIKFINLFKFIKVYFIK